MKTASDTQLDDEEKKLSNRRVFILLDGTGNDFKKTEYTNVVRMLRLLRKDKESEQVVYYGEGLGEHNFGRKVSRASKVSPVEKLFSMGFGSTIADNILDAYRWLMNTHQEGDKIFVMGFSRGAYAAGCLCGLVEAVGLLPRENSQMLSTAWDIYSKTQSPKKQVNTDDNGNDDYLFVDDRGTASRSFRTSFSKLVRFQFLGLWDTVASVGFFGGDPFYFPQHHGTVANIYHAMALDEPRNRFQVRRLTPASSLKRSIYRPGYGSDKKPMPLTTTVTEIWFSGVHTSIGGGNFCDMPSNTKLPNVTEDGFMNKHVIYDIERSLPNRSPAFLTLAWMLRAIVKTCKHDNIPLPLFDPYTLERYSTELLFLNPNSSQADYPSPLRSQNYVDNLQICYESMGKVSNNQILSKVDSLEGDTKDSLSQRALPTLETHELILEAMRKAEVGMASMMIYNAHEYFVPNWTLTSLLMTFFWNSREVFDFTFWKTRPVKEGDQFHVSVLARWVASRCGPNVLKQVLDDVLYNESTGVLQANRMLGPSTSFKEPKLTSEIMTILAHDETISKKATPMTKDYTPKATPETSTSWDSLLMKGNVTDGL